MRPSLRVAAMLGFAGLSVLCGVGVHLVAELAALGWSADGSLIVSARHIPLGLLTVAALLALATATYPARAQRGRVASIVRALPEGGSGFRFVAIAAAAQFGVFGLTEAGEGLPIGAGDLGLAFIAALCASIIGALLVARYKTRVIEALTELFTFILRFAGVSPAAAASWRRTDAHVRVWRSRALTFAASLRPPPGPPVAVRFSPGFAQEYRVVQDVLSASHRALCGIEPRARRFSPIPL